MRVKKIEKKTRKIYIFLSSQEQNKSKYNFLEDWQLINLLTLIDWMKKIEKLVNLMSKCKSTEKSTYSNPRQNFSLFEVNQRHGFTASLDPWNSAKRNSKQSSNSQAEDLVCFWIFFFARRGISQADAYEKMLFSAASGKICQISYSFIHSYVFYFLVLRVLSKVGTYSN